MAIHVPINDNDSKKLDTPLLPKGWQLCTIYGLVITGHHETKWGKKLQAQLGIEFPLHKAQFYEDQEPKPYGKWDRIYNLTFYKNGNFRKQVEEMIGKKLTDDEAAKFDLESLVGKNYVAKISHTDDGQYFNIDSISELDDQFRSLFQMQPGTSYPQINDTKIFSIGTKEEDYNFLSQDFANLPNWLKDIVKESSEAKEWIAIGNSFPENTNNSSSQKVTMIATDFTYQQYIDANYTDELLVAEGKAKWNEPQTPKAPLPKAPAPAPASPSAPAPAPVTATVQPSAPVAKPTPPSVPTPPNVPKPPSATKTFFKFNDPTMQPYYDKFIADGWTDETLVSEGMGVIVTE